MTPGSTPTFDCPHVDGIAVSVTVIGGDHSITCPRCPSAIVERALGTGLDPACILIQQAPAPAAPDTPNPEDGHRARWAEWADCREPLSEAGF